MESERAFSCGNNRYCVVDRHGRLVVYRQDWLGRSFVSYARDLAHAIALIEADAGCYQVRAA
jgi:hypothetical protein